MRRSVPIATLASLAALAVPATALATSGPADRDYAATARNIIPSGEPGGLPGTPAQVTAAERQAKMYDALTPRFDQVTNADLARDFKSEGFGVGKDGPARRERVPFAGVTLLRDRFDVPHITAKRYDAAIETAGFVMAEDRGLLLQQARYDSRVAVVDAPGLSAIGLVSKLQNFVPSAQTEAATATETAALEAKGAEGRAVLHDIDLYVKGINTYWKQTKSPNKPFTRNDIYAFNALKDQFLGEGGGDEARRSELLSGLTGQFGAGKGLSVFNDLRQHDNPETPVSIDGSFPYEPVPADKSGNAILDAGSFTPTTYGATPAPAAARAQASNALLVSARKSVTGRPLMVAGPQIGYFYPGLTSEMDMHAPGLNWRGATSVPFPGYLLIGRGADFAISLTSASGDDIDEYVETLCGGSDTMYLYDGTCRPMRTFDAGTLTGTGGAPDQEVTFPTTVHGPVVGYATVGGVRVAISRKRASAGQDVVDLLFNRDLSTGAVRSPKTFFAAAAKTPQTFNSFYVDDKHIAEYTSGLLPQRPRNVDPGLPTVGTGKEEWTGYLPKAGHPHEVDPKSGRIVNWNNDIAHGFGTADDEWSRGGSVERVDLLNKNLDRLAKKGKWSLATMTSAMNAAGTQDVRAIDTVPLLAKLLAGSTAPSPRDRQMLDLLVAWSKAGGSRLDRNGDGTIDAPGAAILDTAWKGIADATLSPVLGPQLDEFASLVSRFDAPPSGQYAGWYQYFDKDVRRLLGQKVEQPYANRYCGAGDKAACQASMWSALDAAGDVLAASQGTADPSAWHADAKAERITFVPGLLPLTLRYANRPSGIQQVISFKGHR